MYEKLTESYVLDPENRDFLAEANPWALHGIAERLLEAADRGLWEEPDPRPSTPCARPTWRPKGDLEE